MHTTLLGDWRTVATSDGRYFIGDVEFYNPDECLSCGHIVTVAERVANVTRILDLDD